MANSKPSDPSKDSGRAAEAVEQASETVIVDNTDAEETPTPAAEAVETDLGDGTVMVSYR